MSLRLKPVGYKEACAFIDALHRHHRPPQGHKFSIGAEADGKLVGVVCVGRPVARKADNGWTAEVTRLCTDGTENACSLLYGAAARAAKAMGYQKVITYILASEDGASLRASGWEYDGDSPGRSWSCPSRPRDDEPLGPKKRYTRRLASTLDPAVIEAVDKVMAERMPPLLAQAKAVAARRDHNLSQITDKKLLASVLA